MEARLSGGRFRSQGLEAGRRGVPVALIIVLLIRLPYLNQAIQGDDHTYLAEAEHALIEPLHPAHTTYIFQGAKVDLRGHPHPPLNAWVLAALIGIFDDVREVPFHTAYVAFSLIAAASMWSLARRFSPRPLWATLLFLAVPAFVVNGNSLESDLPFLAFWMAAIAFFCAGRIYLAVFPMACAAMTAYQAVFLTPILALYLWLGRDASEQRACRAAWTITLTPLVVVATYQIFERLSTGAVPAAVLAGYFQTYALQTLALKLRNAAAMTIHLCFLIFPALLPGAVVLAWRKRSEPDTQFLLAWIGIFFAGAVIVFFAGAARYLLPIAAPVAILASRLGPKWLAGGFAAQMLLNLGLATANYQHWNAVRRFAANLHTISEGRRVWVNGELGLRYYLEADGALPLRRTRPAQPGEIVVSSDLTHWMDVTAPASTIARAEIRPTVPLRLIGIESHSGYSTVSRGLWPFGISTGVVDRLRADLLLERHPTLSYLSLNSPESAAQIVSGIYPDHWMGQNAVVVVKTPGSPAHLAVDFFIPPHSQGTPATRRVTLRLDGHTVASQTYPAAGAYRLLSPPLQPAAGTAEIQIEVDRTFSAPPDIRQLGVLLSGVGFTQVK